MEESTERRERRGSQGGFGAIDFPTFGAVPVSPRALYKLLKRGDPTLLYPGGVREAFKSTKRGESYKLFWPEVYNSADFAPVAARFNATIVPVAAIGAEDSFNMIADADDVLATPFLGERVAESARSYSHQHMPLATHVVLSLPTPLSGYT
mmetsp:Transcript_9431/g.28688  ORF Transcript_9431/g.28688 Transcript_9431/m.28688 type:complete len:151 (-) Transcript_9431:902-1354(-)